MKRKTNCLFFALALYFRRKAKGKKGYLLLRASPNYPGPHVLYARKRKDGTWQVVSYAPKHAIPRWYPPIVFDGEVHWGDRDFDRQCERPPV